MYRLSITVRVFLHYASERYTKIPWLESKMKIPYRMRRELMSALSVANMACHGVATLLVVLKTILLRKLASCIRNQQHFHRVLGRHFRPGH